MAGELEMILWKIEKGAAAIAVVMELVQTEHTPSLRDTLNAFGRHRHKRLKLNQLP